MRTMRPSRFLFASLLLATFAGGCTKPAGTAPAQTSDKADAPPQKLRLLVVDDPALAREIGRVRGEWEAESSAPLEVAEMSTAELSAAKTLAADAIIYPAAELGSLAERQLIQPLPEVWLNRPAYAKHDLFELIGLRETAWAGRIFAVPLGSPVMVCFYRADLFARSAVNPPPRGPSTKSSSSSSAIQRFWPPNRPCRRRPPCCRAVGPAHWNPWPPVRRATFSWRGPLPTQNIPITIQPFSIAKRWSRELLPRRLFEHWRN